MINGAILGVTLFAVGLLAGYVLAERGHEKADDAASDLGTIIAQQAYRIGRLEQHIDGRGDTEANAEDLWKEG